MAAAEWIDATLDRGGAIQRTRSPEKVRSDPECRDSALGVLTLDPALLDDRTERVNITLPRRVLRRLDDLARRAGETRSGFIARLTLTRPDEAA